MKTKMTKANISALSIFALSLLIVGAGVTSAYGGLGNGSERPELTEEQKAVFTQIQDLRSQGDFEGAQAIAEQAGFLGRGGGCMGGEFRGPRGNRPEVETAVENNDYEAFLIAISGSTMGKTITPEIFAKMVEAHALREAGDIEGAQEIMKESGFGVKRGLGGGFMRGGSRNK